MSLVARVIEDAGIPTVVIASARDITESVRPPRAVFVDYPLGHQTGLPGNPASQSHILRTALEFLASATTPGSILDMQLRWSEEFDFVADPRRAGNPK